MATEMVRGLEHKCDEEWLRVVQSGEEEAQGDLSALYNYLKGDCGEVGAGKWTRGNSLKLHQGRFRLDIRNYFFPEEWSGTAMGCPGRW